METAGFAYLAAHPEAVGIALLRPAALALLLGLPVFFRRPHPAGRRAGWLRAGAFVALVAVLAGVRVTGRLPSDRLTLVAAVDLSESIDDAGREWARHYLEQVLRELAPGDEAAVVTFAKEAGIAEPPGPPARVPHWALPASRSATDISRAIDTAVALFPPEGQRRLLLLSDGNETRGDARGQLAWLRERRVRIDVAIPPHGHEPDVSLDKLVVAPLVAEGTLVPIRLVAHNTGKPRPSVLTLFLDGEIVDSAAIDLRAGLSTLEIPYRFAGQGARRLRAQLESAGDPSPGNNYREVPVMVSGKTRVLLLSPRGRSTVAQVLERKAVQVDVHTPDRLPRAVEPLLPYHAVVFEDLDAAGVSGAGLGALERYVREFGGGFVLAGGTATFGDARFKTTPLQRLLPVTLEPRRPRHGAREPLALFILIDRSNSMGYNSRIGTLRDGEKLRYAKEAALAVIRQLKDEDLVGVIAFDSQPSEISPLRPLRDNRALLEDLIPRLVENGGTDFYDSLTSARQQLAVSRVNRRHIILLTDGDTNRAAADHYPLIASVVEAKASVTTIRIGDNAVNLKLLRDISDKTGGQFYHVENVEMLPDLMLRDTTKALGPVPRGEEQFFPHAGSRSQLLRGLLAADMPPLAGYAYSRPKPGAETLLHLARLERRDPLLAVWHYGLGRVVAFTASPADDAERWLSWPEFGKFWAQLVHWVAREQTAGDYAVDVRRRDGITELAVRTFDPAADDGVLLARLHVGPEDVREVNLAPRGPRVFGARLPEVPPGRYPVTITKRGGARGIDERTELVTIPELDDEPQEEQRRRGPNLPLLTHLTEETGGLLNPTARELAARKPGTRRLRYPLDHLLVPLAMLLFLADVAVRRLKRPAGDQPTA